MTIDISPIIAGNANLYYANSEESEPALQREFIKAITANFQNSIVAAEVTRVAKGSVIWDTTATPTGITGSGVADLDVTSTLAISEIKFEGWQDNPLTITGTGGGSFITEAAASGDLFNKALYLQRDGKTVSLPVEDATAAATTLIWPQPTDSDERAILGFILNGANTGDKIKVRFADTDGTEGITGSNANWTELGKNLVMETGFSLQLAQTTTDLRVLSETLPIEQFTTQEAFTVNATIYDVSVETMAFLQNRRPVTKVAAVQDVSAGYRTAELERGPRPTKSALVIRMESTPYLETGGQSQWWIPRCTITSNTAFPISKTATAVPVSFTILRSNLYEKAIKFTAQDGTFSI